MDIYDAGVIAGAVAGGSEGYGGGYSGSSEGYCWNPGDCSNRVRRENPKNLEGRFLGGQENLQVSDRTTLTRLKYSLLDGLVEVTLRQATVDGIPRPTVHRIKIKEPGKYTARSNYCLNAPHGGGITCDLFGDYWYGLHEVDKPTTKIFVSKSLYTPKPTDIPESISAFESIRNIRSEARVVVSRYSTQPLSTDKPGNILDKPWLVGLGCLAIPLTVATLAVGGIVLLERSCSREERAAQSEIIHLDGNQNPVKDPYTEQPLSTESPSGR